MDTQNGTTRGGVAVVTGGSRGLGRDMVQSIARRGTDVIFTYQSNEGAADELVAEVESMGRRAVALQLDVGDAGTFDAFAERVRAVLSGWDLNKFDSLVNNAGFGVYATIAETTEEQFDRLMDVHVKGPFFLTQKLLPLMADGGRIINVSTGLARFALPGHAAYASAKGAVEVMTRYLAVELGPRGISVNVIAPGAIETDFSGGVVRDNPEMNEMIASSTALGRAGLPGDIGGVVASLLSPEMGWVNAQRIEASGGQNL
ncbi:MAG: Reductase [uncultured Rubrobacteraceae bacterium]|uniref:Reductase n=1 Tax=uncultured Rubrobacteraceae bacterium TaxID=349277 RepID=A0A6J4NE45_9ACTN|nr:MAG: Reductase [uncultured Rubrobacteraceae bacterium]